MIAGNGKISTGPARTCVGVLLVSPDFLASDFIQDQELPPLIHGAETGSIILFAIAISASGYEITPLAQYQWANDPAQPLDDLPEPKQNAVLVRIAKEIEKAVAKAAPAPALRPAAPPMRKTLPEPLETVTATDRIAERRRATRLVIGRLRLLVALRTGSTAHPTRGRVGRDHSLDLLRLGTCKAFGFKISEALTSVIYRSFSKFSKCDRRFQNLD